jgi:hypothetical protein
MRNDQSQRRGVIRLWLIVLVPPLLALALSAEIEAWSLQTPLKLHLKYPIIGKEVTVSVLDPWSQKRYATGMVWAWWGGPGRPTFGPLNTRTMTILSAGD